MCATPNTYLWWDELHPTAATHALLAQRAADRAGLLAGLDERHRYSARVVSILVECGGSVDTQYVLEAFRRGDHVCRIAECPDAEIGIVLASDEPQPVRELVPTEELEDRAVARRLPDEPKREE